MAIGLFLLLMVLAPSTALGVAQVRAAGVPVSTPDESTDAGTRTPFSLPPIPPDLPVSAPLVAVPPGCATPTPAVAVFEGTAELIRGEFVRYRVQRLLAGSLAGYAVGDRVDLAYGVDARFLAEGDRYLVGAAPRSDGRLTSSVRPPQPLFGGDAVIGVDDNDVNCPVVDDPVRTLLPGGGSVDSGLLTPLRGSGAELLRALVVPFAVASLVLLVLVALKLLVWAMFRSLRPDPSPHAARTPRPGRRRHRSAGETIAERGA